MMPCCRLNSSWSLAGGIQRLSPAISTPTPRRRHQNVRLSDTSRAAEQDSARRRHELAQQWVDGRELALVPEGERHPFAQVIEVGSRPAVDAISAIGDAANALLKT
jgi:hypothetical protein